MGHVSKAGGWRIRSNSRIHGWRGGESTPMVSLPIRLGCHSLWAEAANSSGVIASHNSFFFFLKICSTDSHTSPPTTFKGITTGCNSSGEEEETTIYFKKSGNTLGLVTDPSCFLTISFDSNTSPQNHTEQCLCIGC